MCEQTEVNYLDGEVVWVKLGSCWWPGEVVSTEKLPPDVLPSFRKPPIAIVKFFQEDTYEYVKNINSIYKYNCSRKNEFINKGLYLYRTKHGPMEKFPEDVIRAETAVGGDIEILTRDEFQETKKESYAGIFGDTGKKTPGTARKGNSSKRKSSESSSVTTPIRKIKEKTDYKVVILVQGTKATSNETVQSEKPPTPSTSGSEPEPQNKNESAEQETSKPEKLILSTPVTSSSGNYSCHACSFTTTRLNVLILHNKTHSASFTSYTPSPVRKKLVTKLTKSSSKTPKVRRPRKDKAEKPAKKSTQAKKRPAEETNDVPKKPKTDEEIKSSLLADWDDGDEESNDESSTLPIAASPEIPAAAESPAVPTPAELPSAQIPSEPSPAAEKSNSSPSSEKPESSSDSKYEFCEDEDWPLEADAGRKIPRVKNPKRKEESKSVSLDDEDVAREVAELLNKTSVPELPSIPEPLKVEENFPEPSIVKSPDKNREKASEKVPDKPITETQPTKAIFKTKTFFRSRHSRSQDAIGKYVAEQLNAVERMDITDSELNGSEIVSSPEARESPPIEQVKVARLAPKIQLKKMKAEAAQQREKERLEQLGESQDYDQFNVFSSNLPDYKADATSPYRDLNKDEKSEIKTTQGVLYPTQEIKPVNTETNDEISKPAPVKDMEVAPIDNIDKMIEEEKNKAETHIDDIEETNNPLENIVRTSSTIVVDKNDNNNKKEPEIINDVVSESNDPPIPVLKFPETTLQKHYEQSIEPYMNESTASAVDALLSVSREADRVTRVISVDPPEDLFEDDYKNSAISNSIDDDGENIDENNKIEIDDNETETSVMVEKNEESQEVNHFIESTKGSSESNFNDPLPVLLDKPEMGKQDVPPVLSIPEQKDMESNKNYEAINQTEETVENVPSESDLQIAEALINLPSTAIQNNDHHENIMLSVVEENIEIESKQDDQDEIVHNTEEVVLDEKVVHSKEEVINKITSENVAHVTDSLLISSNDKGRFETEKEKSENLNAAQSLVEMSESIDHKINIVETNPINNKEVLATPVSPPCNIKPNNGIDNISTVEQKIASLSSENNSETTNPNDIKYETSSSKLLKILEEPCLPKISSNKPKQIIMSTKEKILNFDVAKSSFKGKQSPKQKIIIRRTTPSKSMNNISEVTTPDKIILSRSNHPTQDGLSVQTYTIQTTPITPKDKNTIIIQPKIKKISKPPSKIQKTKPQNSIVAPTNETKTVNEVQNTDEPIFDIRSMPVVLSEDLITPESIEKMPIVMSDGNIITHTQHPPKLVKAKHTVVESEKVISTTPSKPEAKTLLMNPVTEVSKGSNTPNILSKSSKLRGTKPMLVIDKTTGKQKLIMTKTDTPIKEIKQNPPTLIQSVPQSNKTEKLLILPAASSPRPGRAQKIVIDPQTGKAHVLVAKGSGGSVNTNESKPVSAKLISSSDTSTPGNTVMIITNAQGTQSRILLTPEHEKILFPNKQQPNISQLKQITQRIATNTGLVQKTVVTTAAQIKAQTTTPIRLQTATAIKTPTTTPLMTQMVISAKTQTRIVPKQKSAIITSKGQLIVGGRVATTAQNVQAPEIRQMPKRIIASEPKKLVQTIQKTTSEPLIFLQQKSGAVMQLTTAQFEHLQRTGQIVQKSSTSVQENKTTVQKTTNISVNERAATANLKPRIRKTIMESCTPAKKAKQEIVIAPSTVSLAGLGAPVPALAPLAAVGTTTAVPSASNTVSVATTNSFLEFDNFEELLPSTAIARQPELAAAPPPEPAPEPVASLSDGHLMAIPGEHFGGPPGSFYLCVQDSCTLTPIDNRPLVLENHQLVPMTIEPAPIIAQHPERRDILEAALANSDVFHAEPVHSEAPDFRDLNANVSVHCRVSETSTTLNQPIMTPVEVPTKGDGEPVVPSNLEAGLAVIGVTPHTVPTSLELPITVTDPRIAPKTSNPLSGTNYGPPLLPSPNIELSLVTSEQEVHCAGPISMPLLTEEEVIGGKSMPILTEEVGDRIGSPTPLAGRAPRLLTPCSDTSEASAEIPLQPPIQFSVTELARHV